MLVFITGATGFVGRAVTARLLAEGHEVLGLARSDAKAAALEQAGARPIRGDLADTALLAATAGSADAVIHLGFSHDFSNYLGAAELDRAAITAMGNQLAGSNKPLLVTSGTAMLAGGRLISEDDMAPTGRPGRVSEGTALDFVAHGVRVSVLRLPPTVHGDNDHGFVAALVGVARDKGVSAYVGSGDNRWSAVHVGDAANAFVLALSKGVAGARYQPIGEQGIAMRSIAATIGERLGLPVRSIAPEDAAAHFGWIANFAQLDVPASSALTRQRLGWAPKGPTLLDDLANSTYFD